MKRKFFYILIAALMITALMLPGTALAAKGPDYDKKVTNGLYELVSKAHLAGVDEIIDTEDDVWEILQKGQNPWGQGKFSIDADTLTMRVIAHKLMPGAWYQIEVNDKNGPGWTVVSNEDAQYYAQANEDGVIKTTFELVVSNLVGAALEVNIKTAEWALTPTGWLYTPGWGYDYVLYGATTIPVP